MQRAIAAEAALAAAVVAGEVDLTAADSDREEEQAGAEANDQVPGGEGTRVGVGTRRSAPMRSEEDAAAEVCLACQTVYACLFASTYDTKGYADSTVHLWVSYVDAKRHAQCKPYDLHSY